MLLVDRDHASRATLARALEESGHTVDCVGSLNAATDALHRSEVVITDTMSPTLASASALVLVTSGDTSEDARVKAFEEGADDLVVRPLSLREVVLRVRALLRRKRRAEEFSDIIEVGNVLRIDRSALRLWVDGAPVAVTTLEIRLLINLAEQGGRTVTREELLTNVWGDASLSVRVVDTSIRRLRARLGRARGMLRTLRNVGYQLRAE